MKVGNIKGTQGLTFIRSGPYWSFFGVLTHFSSTESSEKWSYRGCLPDVKDIKNELIAGVVYGSEV